MMLVSVLVFLYAVGCAVGWFILYFTGRGSTCEGSPVDNVALHVAYCLCVIAWPATLIVSMISASKRERGIQGLFKDTVTKIKEGL